jgi:drug/metabolite transporter (DMT)-like permease
VKKAFVQLHLAVGLAGFTGILGQLIRLNEGLLVWYRLLISAITLWIWMILRGMKWGISGRDLLKTFGVGALLALHWVCFYGSIKYANVSVGLACFSAVGFFTALLEPLFLRSRPDLREVALGLLVIAGILCIFHFDPHYHLGIAIGLASALLGSLFPICNRFLLRRIAVSTLTVYELTGGFIFLSLGLPFYLQAFPPSHSIPTLADWAGLLALSWFCTVLAFQLSLHALRRISAFTVSLSFNLEPVYGIILAQVILRESRFLNWGFYAGLILILASIAIHMGILWSRRASKAPSAG